ncbi:hypothetical protein CI238_04760 [Colletotrichum incanum]|uniref:Uncharacterized protein n=1 Tax=Colletotrichum incanum TaxID=1573173 RepID=A0A162NUS0_COLIC|nr:hypothetical protein CI238_04760 [Colletotrichum incanum]
MPGEVQDMVHEAASNPETPTMRFVSLRQAVIHETGACPRIPPILGCLCYRARPNYITFWPPTNPIPTRDAVAAASRQGREIVRRGRLLDPPPQKQGDWSLTHIVYEDVYEDRMPTQEVGDPYNCNLSDLVFVHMPTFYNTGQFLYTSQGNPHPQVTWDPLLEQLTSIAMTIVNWETLS